MGKGKIAGIAVAVLAAILVIALVIVPAIMNPVGGNMAVQFYNEGEPVTDPITYGFDRGGVTIDEITVTIGWTITGSDPTALELGTEVSGFVNLYVQEFSIQTNNYYWTKVGSLTFSGIQTLSDNRSVSWMLSSIAELDPTIQTSWDMKVEGQISVVVSFEDGSTQSATWPADGSPKVGTFSLTWDTDSAGAEDLILEGYWSY